MVEELVVDTRLVIGEYDGTKEGNIDTELGESVESHDVSSVGFMVDKEASVGLCDGKVDGDIVGCIDGDDGATEGVIDGDVDVNAPVGLCEGKTDGVVVGGIE